MLSITFPENVGQSYFDWPIFGLVAMSTYFGLVVVKNPSSKNADIKIVAFFFQMTRISFSLILDPFNVFILMFVEVINVFKINNFTASLAQFLF